MQYEIEFFRLVADTLKWEPSMYEFKCMDWVDMEEDLMQGGANGNGTCDMSVAGYSAIPVSAPLCVLRQCPCSHTAYHLSNITLTGIPHSAAAHRPGFHLRLAVNYRRKAHHGQGDAFLLF